MNKQTFVSTTQGRREKQEDRCLIQEIAVKPDLFSRSGLLLAIMDGHGGVAVADLIKERLPRLLVEKLTFFPIKTALKITITQLVKEASSYKDGSTLSLAYCPNKGGEIYLALLGDSPLVVFKTNSQLFSPPLHNVRLDEAGVKQAIRLGAVLAREGRYLGLADGESLIALTRSLGDNTLPFLNRQPDIYLLPENEVARIVIASDGVPSELIVETKSSDQATVDQLVRAGATKTGDNATVIVMMVNKDHKSP